MKAILEYDLNDIDDTMSHLRAVKSLDMTLVIFEIVHNLRKKCESICEGLEADSDKYDGVYVVFEEISKLLNEYNINTDELIR
jgi:hypothetical protein